MISARQTSPSPSHQATAAPTGASKCRPPLLPPLLSLSLSPVGPKRAVLVALLALLCGPSTARADDALPAAVTQALRSANVPADALAAVAIPLSGPAWLNRPWRHRAQVPMQPASTMKVVTSIVALDRVGAQQRGHTELRSAAPVVDGVLQGDLVLVGGADPDLGLPQFWAMLMELREQGITSISGDLVLDRTLFRPTRLDLGAAPFDESPEFDYNAIPDALQLVGNLLPIEIKSDATSVRVRSVPTLLGLSFGSDMLVDGARCNDWDDNWKPASVQQQDGRTHIQLQGSFPAACSQRAELQLIDRQELAERLFRTLWTGLGGQWAGLARELKDASEKPANTRLLVRRNSRPWGEVLRPLNKTSDNAHSRLLYLMLGVPAMVAEPQTTTLALAEREVRRWLAEQRIDDTGLVLENGSGLSRSERISPLQLAQMLAVAHRSRYAADLQMSLPVAGVDGSMRRRLKDSPATGWARLKTGTLRNVAALAGYVRDPQGRPWAVAMMINHDDAAKARPALDALIDSFARVGPQGLRGRGERRP
jgi:serine-type D-Ala-D-Ala carboxypeptidase/endopeptidase (penicillin-binding protein 4)